MDNNNKDYSELLSSLDKNVLDIKKKLTLLKIRKNSAMINPNNQNIKTHLIQVFKKDIARFLTLRNKLKKNKEKEQNSK